MNQQFLRGQIIRILDDQRLLINIGAEQGLCVGDQLCVYDPGEEIQDTFQNQSLGQIELVKAMVEAVHVQEKMAVAMPPQRERPSTTTVLSATLAAIPVSGKGDPYRDRLAIRHEQVSGVASPSPIAVGNWVRTVKRKER